MLSISKIPIISTIAASNSLHNIENVYGIDNIDLSTSLYLQTLVNLTLDRINEIENRCNTKLNLSE